MVPRDYKMAPCASCRLLLALAASPCLSSRLVRTGSVAVRPRAGALLMTSQQPWKDTEDWALADAAPQFTVGRGDDASTFWTALASSTPDLALRSAAECESRLRELKKDDADVGQQPPVLEDWSKLEDGRYTGRVAGESSFVWLTPSMEGRIASDPRVDRPGYIEAVGGKIFELGRVAAEANAAVSSPGGPGGGGGVGGPVASPSPPGLMAGLPVQAATLVGAALVASGIGFGLGSALAPPPPPPPPARVTRVFIQGAAPTKSLAAKAEATRSADSPRQLSPAALTLTEQRERAELRVDRDKLKVREAGRRFERGPAQ